MTKNNPDSRPTSQGESAQLRQELEAARRVLGWILDSRIWSLATSLRKLKHKARSFRRGGIEIVVASPTADEIVGSRLELCFTVASRSKVSRVEIFLDYVLIADLPPIEPNANENSGKLNYSFSNSVPVAGGFSGKRLLTIRVQNLTGAVLEYEQEVTIEAAPGISSNLPLSEIELQTFKRSADKLAGVDLAAFLQADARIKFPEPAQPKVSIVLVTHNRAELTLRCLLSIAAHDFDDLEVIVIDNQSIDKTKDLLSRIPGARVVLNPTNVHFLKACNQATDLANGKYLLFLNNDAELKHGTIRSAVDLLEQDATVGAVGARIVLPNATLQEAGGIVWNDGRTSLYGRGGDPMSLQYLFRRDVDYCSGAFLVTPRELFVRLGKFDEAFAPAYYEETDYCVRLWEHGYRVVYEPKCVIEHYEFGSSKNSGSAEVLINKNLTQFRSKHSSWLNGQFADSPANVRAASSPIQNGTKRILLLESELPKKERGSGYPRVIELIWSLAGLGHRITVMPLQNSLPPDVAFYNELPPEVEIAHGGSDKYLADILKERQRHFDILWISRPENMATVRQLHDAEPKLFEGIKLVYDSEAIYALRETLQTRLIGRNGNERADNNLDAEIARASICDEIIAVSESEAAEFRIGSKARVHTIGGLVRSDAGEAPFHKRSGILFVGALHTDHSPNVDSLRWFLQRGWPTLRDFQKDLKLTIIGQIDPEIERELNHPGVTVKGTVANLKPHYNNARIVIAPTRFAAGVPNKVIEAAANGVPVVATPLLADQLGWTDELIVADEAEFGEACIRLYSDETLWSSTRKKALKRVREEYDPAAISLKLQTVINERVSDAAQGIST